MLPQRSSRKAPRLTSAVAELVIATTTTVITAATLVITTATFVVTTSTTVILQFDCGSDLPGWRLHVNLLLLFMARLTRWFHTRRLLHGLHRLHVLLLRRCHLLLWRLHRCLKRLRMTRFTGSDAAVAATTLIGIARWR